VGAREKHQTHQLNAQGREQKRAPRTAGYQQSQSR
jgi:hypothetical protein